MRDITDKLSLQGTKNNVTQVQEMSNSIQPALPNLLCPLPSPTLPSRPLSFDLFLTLIQCLIHSLFQLSLSLP